MGGPSIQEPLNPVITARLNKARRLTEQQVVMAKEIAEQNFGRGVDPAIQGAVLEALATNYHATVHASKD